MDHRVHGKTDSRHAEIRRTRPRRIEGDRKDLRRRASVQGDSDGGQVPQIADVTVTTGARSWWRRCESAEMMTALRDALAKIEQQAVRQRQKSDDKRHPAAAEGGGAEVARRLDGGDCRKKASDEEQRWEKAVPLKVHSFPSKSPIRSRMSRARRMKLRCGRCRLKRL